MLLASGMAATSTALLALLKSGDEVVCSAAIYGGTLHLLRTCFRATASRRASSTLEELRQPERVIGDRTKVLWFESPINPTLRCVDIAAIAAACRARDVISIIDNTFASPLNQQPLAMGVDIVMHSVTKYLNGHSDVTAGALAGPARLMKDDRQGAQAARRHRRSAGGLCDRPRHQDAVGADGAAQRQRHGGGALARDADRDARRDGVLSRGSNRIPITRSRRSR